jgi:putative sigma-54 modulation protein
MAVGSKSHHATTECPLQRNFQGLPAALFGGIVAPNVSSPSVISGAGGIVNPENRRPFMNLTISGHHLEVTPALRSYVTSKLDRISRHFDQVVDIKVLLTVDNQKEKEMRQRAECNIHVKGKDLFAESAHEDLYAAVDELADKLDRQVIRYKDKSQEHHHDPAKRLM